MIAEAFIDSLRLHGDPPHGYPCALRSFDGLGSPNSRENRPERARRHGAVELTTYYGARVIALAGIINGTSDADMWTQVDTLKRSFALVGSPHVLKFKRQGLAYFERCVVTVGSPLELPLRVVGPVVPWSATIVAADPRLYADTVSSASFAATATVTNGGNFGTPPVITFHGGGTNPGIQNTDLATENLIQMTYVMAGGDTIVVDVAARSVTLNGADRPDILNAATSSFWSLVSGTNALVKVGGATSIDIAWRDARI